MHLPTLKKPRGHYKAALFLNDLVWSVAAFVGCAVLYSEVVDPLGSPGHLATLVIIALAAIALFNACLLYNYHVIYHPQRHLAQLAKAWGCNTLILVSAFGVIVVGGEGTRLELVVGAGAVTALLLLLRRFNEEYAAQLMTAVGLSFILVGWLGLQGQETAGVFMQSYPVILAGLLVAVITVSLTRYLLVHQVFGNLLRRRFRRQTLIVGPNAQAERITRYIIDTNAPFWVTGIMGRPADFGRSLPATKAHLGEAAHLPDVVADNDVTEVIVTDETIDKKTLVALLDFCASRRINVWFPPGYMPVISVKLVVGRFCGLPMIHLGTQKNLWLFNTLKYSLDALVTLPAVLLQLPLFLAIAAAVKLTSCGPVFYRPTVIGKSGRPFTMYKFRSMRPDADCAVHKAYVTRLIKGEIKSDANGGQVLKLTNDDRITPVGRILRKFSLDELPQLLNVLKGDMSLIGPRPCLPYEYEAYEEWHKKRTAVRPGITGLWQVVGRSEVSFEEMILLDLYYIYNRSFSLDLSILLETVVVVLGKKGAY